MASKDYELIISEKPAAAQKIASALASGKPIKQSLNGVPYYEITRDNKDIVVASAVGHLFSLAEKNKKNFEYPVFSVEWVPTSDINKASAFSKKYLTVLKKLAKDAKEFTIATDYDIEGEVIGYTIIHYGCKQKDANRMKFSTLTKDDLVEAYENKAKTIDWGQAHAGLTRHELDWYYGINLSRALTASIKATGAFKIMSSGRVQGPALKILVDREREIKAFVPVPYWQIELKGELDKGPIIALHKEDKIWEKPRADEVMTKTKGHDAKISEVKKKSFKQKAPTPFDLTTLQMEAYRCFNISPKETLSIAQDLYTSGYISYPRTSSQKLPAKLGFKKILNSLGKNELYKELANAVLKTKLVPNEGKKDDPAHPSIYPTGNLANVGDRKQKIYDLIVKRFCATFGPEATRETVTLTLDCNTEPFVSKGTRTIDEGWHKFYKPYIKLEEEELPICDKDDIIKVKSITQLSKQTQPPKRFTPASIIKELEKRGLGTKATRASIIDTLFDRKYIVDKAIKATDLGIKTIETLEKYSPRIIDQELTTHFEDEMELIREEKSKPENTLKEAKDALTEILGGFKEKEKEIGKELISAYRDTQDEENTLGPCPICKKGNLMMKRGKFGRFIACSAYPECKSTFKIPQSGMVKTLKTPCEKCNFPVVSIYKKGAKPQQLCINPECETKKSDNPEEAKAQEKQIKEVDGKKCPKCGNELLVRKSIYGQFIGCSNYPKCKYTEKLGNDKTGDDLL